MHYLTSDCAAIFVSTLISIELFTVAVLVRFKIRKQGHFNICCIH